MFNYYNIIINNTKNMQVVNIKKKYLNESGYMDFESWSSNPTNLYIGRNMNFYVKGAFASKWQNPFPVKKYGLEKCLELYEEYVRTSGLINDLDELKDKTLGCWCKPDKCHGDILCKLVQEKNI